MHRSWLVCWHRYLVRNVLGRRNDHIGSLLILIIYIRAQVDIAKRHLWHGLTLIIHCRYSETNPGDSGLIISTSSHRPIGIYFLLNCLYLNLKISKDNTLAIGPLQCKRERTDTLTCFAYCLRCCTRCVHTIFISKAYTSLMIIIGKCKGVFFYSFTPWYAECICCRTRCTRHHLKGITYPVHIVCTTRELHIRISITLPCAIPRLICLVTIIQFSFGAVNSVLLGVAPLGPSASNAANRSC